MNQYFPLPSWINSKFICIDCGARDDTSNPIVSGITNYVYLGFEPDSQACEKLQKDLLPCHSFYPIALGKEDGFSDLYITNYPGCSSLYKPNVKLMDTYLECDHYYDITDIKSIQVSRLDKFLQTNRINDLDFIELDTQGSELDILKGAGLFISEMAIGIKIEVEFIEMYENQPLYDKVHKFLIDNHFILFDLKNYYLHRKISASSTSSKGQLCWAQAYYLRDYSYFFNKSHLDKLWKLIYLSSFLQFHDYAVELIIKIINSDEMCLEKWQKDEINETFKNIYCNKKEEQKNNVKFSTVMKKLKIFLGYK